MISYLQMLMPTAYVQRRRQVSALQRLTGVLDYESRLAIYRSFIMSNYDYCPIVCFLLAVLAFPKWKTIQERALRFVLKDSRSSYEEMLGNLKVDSIGMNVLKKVVRRNQQAFKRLESGLLDCHV